MSRWFMDEVGQDGLRAVLDLRLGEILAVSWGHFYRTHVSYRPKKERPKRHLSPIYYTWKMYEKAYETVKNDFTGHENMVATKPVFKKVCRRPPCF